MPIPSFTETPPTLMLEHLKPLLESWSQIQPACCVQKRPMSRLPEFVFYQVLLQDKLYDVASTHPWHPCHSELALIDRSVQLAVEAKGWTSDVVPGHQPGQARGCYHGHVYLSLEPLLSYSHAISHDPAIARLAAHLNALNGHVLGTFLNSVESERALWVGRLA